MNNAPLPDASPTSWVHTYAPEWARPYLSLGRFDRPAGIWLLYWPCAWSTALAGAIEGDYLRTIGFLLLFLIGATAMRAAGCVWNDMMDKDLDAQVERTRNRPLAAGLLTLQQAAFFMLGLCCIGLLVLVFFNTFTILLGLSSILLVCAYPFAKRFTNWPQFVLGLTFNWGALMGWAAITGGLDVPAFALYIAGICWTLGYDTIYAHQDQRDDAIAGIGSTAQFFGAHSKQWIMGFYGMAVLWLFIAVLSAHASPLVILGIAGFATHLAWQVLNLDINDEKLCLKLFKSNVYAGAFAAIGLMFA